eukprot:5311060-Prymnesium_polylepis.1
MWSARPDRRFEPAKRTRDAEQDVEYGEDLHVGVIGSRREVAVAHGRDGDHCEVQRVYHGPARAEGVAVGERAEANVSSDARKDPEPVARTVLDGHAIGQMQQRQEDDHWYHDLSVRLPASTAPSRRCIHTTRVPGRCPAYRPFP